MAGALNRIESLRYMSDHENRLRRFKSNLQHIFEKYENCADDDTEIDLTDLSVCHGRKQFVQRKTKKFGHSKLRSTPREDYINSEAHGQKSISPIKHQQQTEARQIQQQPDLQGTYIVSTSEDLWNSHRNLPIPPLYDPDSPTPQQSVQEDHDSGNLDNFSDDSSRIQCLNETYKDVLSLFGPDEDEDISDAETLTSSSDSEDSFDEDFEELIETLSSSEESEKDQNAEVCMTREMGRGFHGDLQSSPRMESYFASSEDSSGYHSADLHPCLNQKNGIHKLYRHPKTVNYRQVQNHSHYGDSELVRMKRPNYRQQIQKLYQKNSSMELNWSPKTFAGRNCSNGEEKINQINFEAGKIYSPHRDRSYRSKDSETITNRGPLKHPQHEKERCPPTGMERFTSLQTRCSNRRNSLCLDDLEESVNLSQSMVTNCVPECYKESDLKEGTPGLNNQPMSSIEKVTKWIMPRYDEDETDRYMVKAKRKLAIQKVSEPVSKPYHTVNEMSSIVSSYDENTTFNKTYFPSHNQTKNVPVVFDQDRDSVRCHDANCSCQKRTVCSCTDCLNLCDRGPHLQQGPFFQDSESGDHSADNLYDEYTENASSLQDVVTGRNENSSSFACPTSPRARDSTSFPPSVVPLSPRTSTEISAYPPSQRPSTFFSSPRAQSCPSSPQTSKPFFANVSNSPSSSLARLRLTSPRSSGHYYRTQEMEDDSQHHQAMQSVPAVFKVPNAFPYERSPSTRQSLQKTQRVEGKRRERQFGKAGHTRSSSCDSRSDQRFRSSFYHTNGNDQEQAFYKNNIDNSLEGRFSSTYQQDRMNLSEISMLSQRDWKPDSRRQRQCLEDYRPSPSRESVSGGQRSNPKCSDLFASEKPRCNITLRSIKDTCKIANSDRGYHWEKPVHQLQKISPRGNLQSTPRKRNCKLVLDTSLSTINPNMDSSSDDDDIILI